MRNPTAGIRRFGSRKVERFLTPEERRRVHEVFESALNIPRGRPGHVDPFSVWAIKLLMLTGLRRDEILTLTWPMVDWQHACFRDEAGIPDVRLHDLRHSFASDALMAGVPLAIVGEMLGHKEPNTNPEMAHAWRIDAHSLLRGKLSVRRILWQQGVSLSEADELLTTDPKGVLVFARRVAIESRDKLEESTGIVLPPCKIATSESSGSSSD